jgi:phosphoribosylformylglycinamidine cyclo-ligase
VDAYRAAGVDYSLLDRGKRLALDKALSTSGFLGEHGGLGIDASRGASAFVFEAGGMTCALVVEGLGTKSIVARQVHEQLGADRYADVAYDTVAAIVNDLCSVGALPLVVNAYFATGSSGWYEDEARFESLLEGWRQACEDARCTWGGGESPSLPDLVDPTEIELAGSAFGAVPEGAEPILGERLGPGDEIVLVASSGLHANGASLVRRLAGELPEGYGTALPGGETLGEAVLTRSHLYVDLVAELQRHRVPATYLSHITGHGLLKIMRAPAQLTYTLTELPPVPDVLRFVADQSGMDDKAAYSTLNMGSGFAVYTKAGAGAQVAEIATALGHQAILAGAVAEGPRQVIVEPLGITYAGEEMILSPGGRQG